ncbi:NUDIX domain-containing protein [Streptomyces sp. UNOC14_S4]|uniref:bifunctional class I SAM-dependent methyltransferase/NUDIX hydrolase n=1 Tax=Streptomyces sp. UNOC14_S4 TaxID=2872340 RepID=UPI0023B1EF7B|nr:NUDIX domain-containing protein [Streptomyces sp. UNOC14_S4]MCC3768818.1 NUDIX domain-containing protein [Streptomyces sp. UNOC14_S4]
MDSTTTDVWDEFGRFHLDRGSNLPEPERIVWGFWDGGPGDEVLGDLAGCRVLDIGSGTGRYAVHLARAHGAVVDAVDGSRTQYQRALDRYRESEAGVRFVLADILDHLRWGEEPYDVAYATHAVGFVDPHRLLPALATRVRPGGRLVFSVLHTNRHGLGPSTTVRPRPEGVRLGSEGMLTTPMWVLTPALWEDLLVEAGFLVEDVTLLPSPVEGDPVVCQLITARRQQAVPRARVASRPRSAKPPIARAALGVCVIVTDTEGRVLLGLHRSGVWECPGGKAGPGESIEETAVRELREETSLSARTEDVEVIALLLDEAGGMNRVTAVAVVAVHTGTPAAVEPDLVSRWEWAKADELPGPLLVPSAQALRAWRPELPVDHPPVHRYRMTRQGD